MLKNIIITIFFIVMVANFSVSALFFYLARVKKFKINKSPKYEGQNNTPTLLFSGDNNETPGFYNKDLVIGEYKVSTIVNTINDFSKDFNNTNKIVNRASAIVTLLSGFTCLASALLLFLN